MSLLKNSLRLFTLFSETCEQLKRNKKPRNFATPGFCMN